MNYEAYKALVEASGGSRAFNPSKDNYFVYYDHRICLWNTTTVNDKCEAPERLYMDFEVALKVQTELNCRILKEIK